MIQIPLSLVGDPEAFAAALATHRANLADHRMGGPEQPAPIAHELLDRLILRVPDSNPDVAERGPDSFEIAPYEIIDDTPPPPTLAQRKQALHAELQNAGQAAIDKVLSPARARLLSMEFADASAKKKNLRNAADKATIKQYAAFSDRADKISRIVIRAAAAIDDLTETKISKWTVPTFD